MLRLGREGYSKFLHKVIFGGFNSRFKDAMTSNDWLSRDKLSVENIQKILFAVHRIKSIMG